MMEITPNMGIMFLGVSVASGIFTMVTGAVWLSTSDQDEDQQKNWRTACLISAAAFIACITILSVAKISDEPIQDAKDKNHTAYVQQFKNASNYRFNAKSNKFAKLR